MSAVNRFRSLLKGGKVPPLRLSFREGARILRWGDVRELCSDARRELHGIPPDPLFHDRSNPSRAHYRERGWPAASHQFQVLQDSVDVRVHPKRGTT